VILLRNARFPVHWAILIMALCVFIAICGCTGTTTTSGPQTTQQTTATVTDAPTPMPTTKAVTAVVTTKATPVPTTKAVTATVVPTQTLGNVVTPIKTTKKDVDLYISNEYVRPYKQDWLEGYEHSVEISNRGSENFKGNIALAFENNGFTERDVLPGVEIPAHGSIKYDFSPFGGGCNKNPDKVGIVITGYG